MGDTFGGGSSTSQFQAQQFPGLFGAEDPTAGARVGTTLESLLTTTPEALPFAPTTASEQELISSLINLTQGQTATAGLGPATQGALTQAIAPTLVDLREAEAQRGVTTREQDIGGLLGLSGLAMPQIVGGQVSQQTGPGIGASALTGLTAGLVGK